MVLEVPSKKFPIGCYLSLAEANELDQYARRHELSRPNLCGLLIVRELHVRSLGTLIGRYAGSGKKGVDLRVTARVEIETKEAFDKHLLVLGVGKDDAAAVIFRTELDERWLASAIGA